MARSMFTILILWSIPVVYGIEFHSPCIFNPLCTCSKSGPDLGEVRCHDVPFVNIPKSVNETQMFSFSMKNNNLRIFTENSLFGTGIWKIEITHNQITNLGEFALRGLEKSLSQLILSNNRLIEIPKQPLKSMDKLKHLDLSENSITKILPKDFDGINTNLRRLYLRGNSIDSIAEATFQELDKCEELDLSSNYINYFHELAFSKNSKLTNLNLGKNLLTSIPFSALSSLSHLSILNLEGNRITRMYDVIFPKALSLDTLILDENEIESLSPFSFQNFEYINKTFIRKNPLTKIENNAFKDAKIKDIQASENLLNDISEDSFNGLETTLHTLNLSQNNLDYIRPAMFKGFDELRSLDLSDNKLDLDLDEVFNGSRYTIQHLFLTGNFMSTKAFQDLRDIRNLRTLALSSLPDNTLRNHYFSGISLALKNLHIQRYALEEIEEDAFYYMPGVNSIDFSNNKIQSIDENAFSDIGSNAEYVNLRNSLGFLEFPYKSFKEMTEVIVLDVSNNNIEVIPTESFTKMRKLKRLDLNHNAVQQIGVGFLSAHNNPDIEHVDLSMNKIQKIPAKLFKDMGKLKIVNLRDNDVTSVERSSFVNLDNAIGVNLRGNKIVDLSIEAFQNLPKLEILDISQNEIVKFPLHCLDQVGALSNLVLNLSHNAVQSLPRRDRSNDHYMLPIRVFDLAHNNISFIHHSYFVPIKNSITKLILSNNNIHNITGETFGKMKHLQLLDLNSNKIDHIVSDAFIGIHKVQIINLRKNNISVLPETLFSGKFNLRVLSLSENNIPKIKASTFEDSPLEILDLSFNSLARFPVDALLQINSSLYDLDISFNRLRFLGISDFNSITRLVSLNLAGNRIVDIAAGSFQLLNNLVFLDLSHNPLLKLTDGLLNGADKSLEELKIANVSFQTVPKLNFPKLMTLNISNNLINGFNNSFFYGLPSITKLDFSLNKVTKIKRLTWAGTKLKWLDLSGNKIKKIYNDTFDELKNMNDLRIQELPITFFDYGAISKMAKLNRLSISNYRMINLNLRTIIISNYALQHLTIYSTVRNFYHSLDGKLQKELSHITFVGESMSAIHIKALAGLTSRKLHLSFRHTSIQGLPQKFFKNLGNVRTLHLDLRNNLLTSMERPFTSTIPGLVGEVYVSNLKLADNPWNCGCNIGWLKPWVKSRTQYPSHDCQGIWGSNCDETFADLRRAECHNRVNQSLADAIRHHMDCGKKKGTSGEPRTATSTYILIFLLISLTFHFPSLC